MITKDFSQTTSMTRLLCEKRSEILRNLVDLYSSDSNVDVEGLLDEFYSHEVEGRVQKEISPIRGLDVSDLVNYVSNFSDQSIRLKFIEGMASYEHTDLEYLSSVRGQAEKMYVGKSIDDAIVLDGNRLHPTYEVDQKSSSLYAVIGMPALSKYLNRIDAIGEQNNSA